ncbi:hypothetical protein AAMO2058_001123200 [Amorphochlora amoebiformis]
MGAVRLTPWRRSFGVRIAVVFAVMVGWNCQRKPFSGPFRQRWRLGNENLAPRRPGTRTCPATNVKSVFGNSTFLGEQMRVEGRKSRRRSILGLFGGIHRDQKIISGKGILKNIGSDSGELSLEKCHLQLRIIPEGSLDQLTSLENLNLSHNLVRYLPQNVFRYLSALKSIDLSHNSLHVLHGHTFSNLLNLTFLDVSHNDLIELPKALLQNMGKLRHIYINANRLSRLSDGFFSSLTSLRKACISRNNLQNIPARSFAKCRNLEDLDLSFNRIRDLDPKSFLCLPGLTRLRLDDNCIQTFSTNLFDSLECLQELGISGNNISEISRDLFRSLTSVRVVEADRNRFLQVDESLHNMGALEHLSLGENSIRNISAFAFRANHNLMFLSLVNNSIEVLPRDVFIANHNLKTLHLSHNQLKDLPNLPPSLHNLIASANKIQRLEAMLRGLHSLQILDLHDNKISEIFPDSLRDLRSLQALNLAGNRISYLTRGTFHSLTSLRSINLNRNSVSEVPHGVFEGAPQLVEINLFENNISAVYDGAFRGIKELKHLHISRNQIRSLSKDVFENLDNLEYLSLFENDISELHPDCFKPLKKLKFLSLHKNRLSSIPKELFQHNNNLQCLHLSYNSLSSLHPDTFQSLENLQILSLDHNRLGNPGIRTENPGIPPGDPPEVSGDSGVGVATGIPPGVFRNLKSLQHLSLSNNGLRGWDLGVFAGLENLQQLKIQENNISTLDTTSFEGLRGLKMLNISKNNLSTIKDHPFLAVPQINHLEVSQNQISEVSPELFKALPELRFLAFHSNPISAVKLDGYPLFPFRLFDMALYEYARLQADELYRNGTKERTSEGVEGEGPLIGRSHDASIFCQTPLLGSPPGTDLQIGTQVVVLDFKAEFNNRLGTVTAFFEPADAAVKFPGPTRSVSIPISCLRNVNQPPPGVQVLSRWMSKDGDLPHGHWQFSLPSSLEVYTCPQAPPDLLPAHPNPARSSNRQETDHAFSGQYLQPPFRATIGSECEARTEYGEWVRATVDGIFLGVQEESTQYMVRFADSNATARISRGNIRAHIRKSSQLSYTSNNGKERRIDPADGNAYLKTEFLEFYGGLNEWTRAPTHEPQTQNKTLISSDIQPGESRVDFDENFQRLFKAMYPTIAPLAYEKHADLKYQTAAELLIWSILDRIVCSASNPNIPAINSIPVENLISLIPVKPLRSRIISEFVALGFNQI